MFKLPEIIQGGMGLGVSNWKLANAVAQCGQMGVVSCTAIDEIMVRLLQLGDAAGNIRRALAKFPVQRMVKPIMDKYFIPGGKSPDEPFKTTASPVKKLSKAAEELLVVSNFVEVFLAKENHDGIVGVNYLEKVQMPALPSLFGAILAGVNCILMGAGIPVAIPGILDKLSKWEQVEMKLTVADEKDDEEHLLTFDPGKYRCENDIQLNRPAFLGIVSSEIVAKTLLRKSTGTVDGFIVENHTAGGHNAPPRKRKDGVKDEYGERDKPDLARIKALNKPFWIAGGYSDPELLKKALAEGASGVQLGTLFAFCKESGMKTEIKKTLLGNLKSGNVDVKTDFAASPTGYPFKLVDTNDFLSEVDDAEAVRTRVCDLGYLRQAYSKGNGDVGYRCPAESEEQFCLKGGKSEQTVNKRCLCNGLLSTVGLGQITAHGEEEPILTGGEKMGQVRDVVKLKSSEYTARDVIDYILGDNS